MTRTIKHILCAVDLSDVTSEITEYAAAIALSMGARVTVVYVVPSMNRYSDMYMSRTELEKITTTLLDGARERMKACLAMDFAGVETEGLVRVGYPSETVMDIAEDLGADMIVMGTHGRKGIDRIIFGSVAEKVVKSSQIPVLTVRPGKGKS